VTVEDIVVSHAENGKSVDAGSSDYLKAFVFGGLDGIVSTFALVAGLGGARMNVGTLIAVSFAKILSDGFSMGFGEFFSAKAEGEHAANVKERQLKIIDEFGDNVAKDLAVHYIENGCPKGDALTLVALMRKSRNLFLEHVLAIKEEISSEPADLLQAFKQGFVCFAAFVMLGAIPVFAFVVYFAMNGGKATNYWGTLQIAYAITAGTLFLMGKVVSPQRTTFVQCSICLVVMRATISLPVMRVIRLTCMSRLEKLTPSTKPIRLTGIILLDSLSSQMAPMEKRGGPGSAKSLMVIAQVKWCTRSMV